MRRAVFAMLLLTACDDVKKAPQAPEAHNRQRMLVLHVPDALSATEPAIWCDTKNGNLIYITYKGGMQLVLGGCNDQRRE